MIIVVLLLYIDETKMIKNEDIEFKQLGDKL